MTTAQATLEMREATARILQREADLRAAADLSARRAMQAYRDALQSDKDLK